MDDRNSDNTNKFMNTLCEMLTCRSVPKSNVHTKRAENNMVIQPTWKGTEGLKTTGRESLNKIDMGQQYSNEKIREFIKCQMVMLLFIVIMH